MILISELFRQKEFVADTTYLRILQEVSDVPGCKISHVVSRMIPEYGEYDVRSRVRQSVLRSTSSKDGQPPKRTFPLPVKAGVASRQFMNNWSTLHI